MCVAGKAATAEVNNAGRKTAEVNNVGRRTCDWMLIIAKRRRQQQQHHLGAPRLVGRGGAR